MTGKIIKGIAGFYYVHVVKIGVFECKAKGVFRKKNVKPLVGDNVSIDVISDAEMTGNIVKVLPRNNELIRPAVANIDQALVVFSIFDPKPNLNLLDRFLVMMEHQKIDTSVCFNKQDLDEHNDMEEIVTIYQNCGYPLFSVSVKENEGLLAVREKLKGKTTVLAGPSGVGKSSLINTLQSEVMMETGVVSDKIGRGRHTTRHTQLIPMDENSYIMDTPGFSSLYTEKFEKEELKYYFPEFMQYEDQCRFLGCSHTHEPDCSVKRALSEGRISESRYENYCLLFDELKEARRF